MRRAIWTVLKTVVICAVLIDTANAQLQRTHIKGVGETTAIINGSLLEQPLWKETIPQASGGMVTGDVLPFDQLGLDNAATLTQADALLRTASPLLALRLGKSVASARRAAGEISGSDAQDAAARALAHRLAASLQGEPELGTCFSASYGESRAASKPA